MKLSVNIAGVEWKNPVTTGSGAVNSGKEYTPYIDVNRLGAITSKGVSLEEWKGNVVPRVTETYGGILSSIGVQNPGVLEFIKSDIAFFQKINTTVIVNICGHTVKEYAQVAEKLSQETGIDMLELNISSPSVTAGGMEFGTSRQKTEEVIKEVKKVTKLPVIVKLSPNVTDIIEISKASEASGADALSMINSVLAMRIDINRRKPVLGSTIGGLSGPAIKSIGVRCVYQAYKSVKIPIIGMGGIMNSDDAIEYMMAGATAVAVGTANFANPRSTIDIINGIEKYLEKTGIEDINEIIGCAHM